MRIITGKLKGRKIKLPKNIRGIRPTSDRTKEGMFGVIDARKSFRDIRILDLFSGSGNLGFEAISRGAKDVLFVDNSREAIKWIMENAKSLDIESQVTCQNLDILRFLQGPPSPYDLVFADPPYDYPEMLALIDHIINDGWLKDDGWFILEHDARHNFADHPHCVFMKPYGRTIVTIFLSYPVYQPDTDEKEEQS
ncbi:MAG TPA: 16S rRNA (guanine(966)-N(2))-methyltransferase RsmD [Balneolales bacterium]|nr:16S rRNA (guanine(966)-N(2))-methyltransferase RsmD [Balneolales bacterium]